MHLHSERLTLLALGDDQPDPDELSHLGRCPACRAEYNELTAIAAIGQDTRTLRDLAPPPPSLWNEIVTATDLPVRVDEAPPRRSLTVVILITAVITALVTLAVVWLISAVR